MAGRRSTRPAPRDGQGRRTAKQGKGAAAPPTRRARQVAADDAAAAPERLQRALARTGLASRREAERMIEAGRISVNGTPAAIGQHVSPRDRVCIDGRSVRLKPQDTALPRVLRYHKPPGEVSSTVSQSEAPTVYERLPRGRWVLVGRLDINTAGLLLFSSDGNLAHRLMHPSAEIEREYMVRVRGALEAKALQALRKGVQLDDGPARFKSIVAGRIDAREDERHNQWYRVVLCEGRNREVRRMFEAVGATVGRLLRVRYGDVELPRSLRPGHSDFLSDDIVRALMNSVGLQPPDVAADAGASAVSAPASRGRARNGRDTATNARGLKGSRRRPAPARKPR